jgi:asparagine synthase (glutamine-hydrolysing)
VNHRLCGISGIYNFDKRPAHPSLLKEMNRALSHRGPDDEGYLFINSFDRKYVELIGDDSLHDLGFQNISDFNNQEFDIAFGHRRLSIIDLSSYGHQPMSNDDRTVWITYNGEIYNYIELREELQKAGHIFHSRTDTEVIIHAYETWGEECLKRFNGMWAFVIWDSDKKRLFCARDRFGVKPFYYIYNSKQFVFASEIKSLLKTGIQRKPDESLIFDYLAFGIQDHTEFTFFDGIKQLKPAHYLLIEEGSIKSAKYWGIEVNEEIRDNGDDGSEFYDLFNNSIQLRMRSDVPVGTCLSGGLDSSSIACVMNKMIPDKKMQKTFSSCFDDMKFDERKYIEAVIEQTGAEKNYIFPKGIALLDEIQDLIYYQDEPFNSLSIYAQWNVMKKASQSVKVLLDGQGGDELLAGYLEYYASYFNTLFFKKKYFLLAKELFLFLSLHILAAYQLFSKMSLRQKRGELLSFEFTSKYKDRNFKYADRLSSKLLSDLTVTKLPALLHYEDRNSMAFSIESRVPFLDYRLVEYAASLPLSRKVCNGMTKVVLRDAMKGVIPESIRKRRDKMGFVTPEEVWMKTVLKDWARDILMSDSFRSRKYWNSQKVLEEFERIFSGKSRYTSDMWRYICLELWLRRFIDSENPGKKSNAL